MNQKQLKDLLLKQTGSAKVVEGYNYAILNFPVDDAAKAKQIIQEEKARIEISYFIETAQENWKLLNFGVLTFPKHINVPCASDTLINVAAEIIGKILLDRGIKTKIPQWG